MNDTPHYASFQDYVAVVRRYRLLIVSMTILLGGAAFAYSSSQDPIYRAEASLSFREPTQGIELTGLPPVSYNTPEERAAIGAQRSTQRRILEATRARLQLPITIPALQSKVAARAEVRTNLTVITVEDEDPELAARIANTIGEEVSRIEREEIRARYDELLKSSEEELRRGLRGRDPITRIQRRQAERNLISLRSLRDFTLPVVFSARAEPPRNSIYPRPVRDTILGAVAGLLLGLLLAFLRWALDRRLRGAREIREQANLPLLGVVRRSALGRVSLGDAKTGRDDSEVDLEVFRIIFAHLEHLGDEAPKRVLVTSPLAEEGKSTVASSLAVVAGLAGRRTLLVECDMRRPVMAKRLGIPPQPGLVDFLNGNARPQDVVRVVSLGSGKDNGPLGSGDVIAAIAAGSDPLRPSELIRSDRFGTFMEQVGSVYDMVILDCPPLLSVADTLELIDHADAIVLCVRSNQTTRDQLRAALETLQRMTKRPAGIVVTGVDPGAEGDYGYYTYSYAGSTRG